MADRLAAVRARSLADAQGLPFVELGTIALDPAALRCVPFEALERSVALPYREREGVLQVAFADAVPAAVQEIATLARRTPSRGR